MKKLVISMLIVLLVTTGCGKIPKLENGQEAVVSLKEGMISVDDLYEEMKKEYALNILINLVDTKILDSKYENNDDENNYTKSRIEQLKMYYDYIYKSQYSSYEDFLQREYGTTDENELKEIFKLDYRRGLAIDDYAKSLVSDSDVNKYYEDKTVGDIEASHILITSEYEDNASTEVKAEADKKALETAKEVIAKLNAGENFEDLVKTYSKDDATKENGGSLGTFNEGSMVEEFWDAVVALKVGEYSKEPVKTQYGYHIILKKSQNDKPSLETVKDSIIEKLAEEKKSSDTYFNSKALVELRKNSDITIEDKELNTQYNNFLYNIGA